MDAGKTNPVTQGPPEGDPYVRRRPLRTDDSPRRRSGHTIVNRDAKTFVSRECADENAADAEGIELAQGAIEP